ncbi:pirin family protein [Rheinheimera sp. UJ51]|uniref:pirin family protein n=1 Tax=Rheinheimera sp. UJ51 TaxID=2892446 RepID=UPI001E522646|nr:pirin family protein [Rheinheimera sp. UJ51]MCC5452753.1 pirin family protein [Rheinheimera sp. UJ51]
MLEIIRSAERGQAQFGWLTSKHSFSFGHYYNPKQMGFSALRVINDDRVIAGAGFSTHGHRNMEIISYVLDGHIAHKDSAGNEKILPAGEFQLMSAGKGIQHSEYNASKTAPLTFLQIWIEPNQQEGEPRYQQKDFGQALGLTWVITPDGRNGTLQIRQDAQVAQLRLTERDAFELPVVAGRAYYLHLISGTVSLAEQTLAAGDGIKLAAIASLQGNVLQGPVNAIWFDLPA